MDNLPIAEELSIVFVAVAAIAIVIWPAAKICRRIGYPAALGVLAIVPLANIALLWFVAVARWPRDAA